MTTPYAPIFRVPASTGMLCNFFGSNAGTYETPPAPTRVVADPGLGTAVLPAGSYTFGIVTSGPGGVSVMGPTLTGTITANQPIDIGMPNMPDGTSPAYRLYLTAAPVGVRLGEVPLVNPDGTGATLPHNPTIQQQGYNEGADNWLTDSSQCTGVGAPAGPGNWDAIPLTVRYSNPNSASRPAMYRLRTTRVGRNGAPSSSENLYDGGWHGNIATQPPAINGQYVPNGAVYSPLVNRVYLLVVQPAAYFPVSNALSAIISAPANGGSVGTWRVETPPPDILNDINFPGSLFILNNSLYVVAANHIQFAAILGDGTLGAWTVAATASPASSGFAAAAAFDNTAAAGGSGGAGVFVFFQGAANTPVASYTLNADGTLTAASTSTMPVSRQYGACFAEVSDNGNPAGYLVYMGGYNGSSGTDATDVYYIAVNLLTGAFTGSWTAAASPLPVALESFGAAPWGQFLNGIPGGVTIAGGSSSGTTQNKVYSAYGNNWYTQPAGQWTQVGTLPANTKDGCSAAVFDGCLAAFTLGATYSINPPGGLNSLFIQNFTSGPGSEVTATQLGVNGTIVNNSDGTVDVTLYANAQTGSNEFINQPFWFMNGDLAQFDFKFMDQNGDPSPWSSTLLAIGQPPSITSASPSGAISTGLPGTSFLYQPGGGGGLEGTWRLQVLAPGGAQVFDTGVRVDQANVASVDTAPLLLSGTAYTFTWTVTSTDAPMNDGHSNNSAVLSTTVTPNYTPPPVPLNFAVATDSTRCAALPSWTNPAAGPSLTPSPAQADPSGSSSLLAGTYGVAYSWLTSAGYETSASLAGSVTIADLPPPASAPVVAQADPTGGAGLGPGSYQFVQTYTNSAGETTASATRIVSIADLPAPASAPVVAQADPTGAAGLVAGTYSFTQTYTNSVGETTASSTGSVTIADITPPSAPTLAQAAASSVFTASEVVHVRYELANTVGRTTPSADTSITISTNGNKVTTTITLPSGATGIRLFVGTSSSALALADISSSGAVTFLGGKSSGVTVVVSGGLQLTITDTASGTGPAQDGSNTAHRVVQWTPPSLPSGAAGVNLYLTAVPGGGPTLGFEVGETTTTPVLITAGGNGTGAPGSSTAHRVAQWTPPSLPAGAASVKLYMVSGGVGPDGFEASATTVTPIVVTGYGNGVFPPVANTAHRVITVPAVTLPGGVTAARWYLTSAPAGVTAGFEVQNSGGPTTITAGGNGTPAPGLAGSNRIYYRRSGTTPWYLLVDQFVNFSERIEAESGAITSGASFQNNHANYSGTGFVAFAGTTNADTFSVTTPAAGTYVLDIRYANGNGTPETLDVVVNGGAPLTLTFPATANWDTWADITTTVALLAGANTIELVENAGDTGHFNVDFINVSAVASSTVLMDQLAIGGVYDFALAALDTSGGMESAMTAAVTGVAIPNPSNGATVMLHIQGSGPTVYVPLMATGGVKVKGFLDVQPAPMFGVAAPAIRYGVNDFREFDVKARLIDTPADPLAATTYAGLQAVFAQLKAGGTGVLRTVAGTMLTVGLSVITSSSSASLYEVDFMAASYLTMREFTLSLLQVPNQYQPSVSAGSALGMLTQSYGSVKPLSPLETAI